MRAAAACADADAAHPLLGGAGTGCSCPQPTLPPRRARAGALYCTSARSGHRRRAGHPGKKPPPDQHQGACPESPARPQTGRCSKRAFGGARNPHGADHSLNTSHALSLEGAARTAESNNGRTRTREGEKPTLRGRGGAPPWARPARLDKLASSRSTPPPLLNRSRRCVAVAPADHERPCRSAQARAAESKAHPPPLLLLCVRRQGNSSFFGDDYLVR